MNFVMLYQVNPEPVRRSIPVGNWEVVDETNHERLLLGGLDTYQSDDKFTLCWRR
jgi:hypothetical protein